MINENTELTQDWDKIFPKSTKVNHTKVTFINRFGITIAADLYEPQHITGEKLPRLQLVVHLVL